MSDMKWGVTKPRFDLLLCAIGIHKFSIHCASAHHGRDTRRECFTCNHADTRLTQHHKWGDHGRYRGQSNDEWNEYLKGGQ